MPSTLAAKQSQVVSGLGLIALATCNRVGASARVSTTFLRLIEFIF
jgi:hypothetical protein